MWVVCDLDGTLCTVNRRRLAAAEERDWSTFHSLGRYENVYAPVRDLLLKLHSAELRIMICTGRPEEYRKMTQQWLVEAGITFTNLIMRPKGDFRSATIVKPELLIRSGLRPSQVHLILDDDIRLIRAFHHQGYDCLQVHHNPIEAPR